MADMLGIAEEDFEKKSNELFYNYYMDLHRAFFKVEDGADWYKKENRNIKRFKY